jgi:tape measure domain-containing protein
MSQVKAGVTYVDVRLGSVDQFKNQLAAKVKESVAQVAKRVEDTFKKNLPKNTGESIGKVSSANMSKAFFKDAGQSFNSGMRALSQGQVKNFGRFMSEAGIAGGLGLKSGFEAATTAVKSAITKTFSTIGNAVNNAFSALPGAMKKVESSLNSLSQKVGFASFQITNLGFIATAAFTAPVAAALTLGTVIGVKTAAQIEQATAALKALTPAGTDVEGLVKRLQKLAQGSPVFATKDVVDFTQKMVASGLTVQQTEAFLKSFGNIALTVGADVSKIPYALEALIQMVGKGKVSMEELRQQLGDALPGAMKIVSDSLHITQGELYDMVKAGNLTGTDLIAALTKLGQTKKYMDGASLGAETLNSKFQQLKETVSNKLGQIFLDNSQKIKDALDKLGPIFDDLIKQATPIFGKLVDGFVSIVDKVKDVLTWYNNLSKGNKDLVNKLLLIAVVAGPIIIALGSLFAAIAGIASGLALIANPAGAVIISIIAVGVALVALYKNSKGLRDEVNKLWKAFMDKVVTPFKGPIKDSINDIKNAFNDFMNTFATKGEEGKRNLSGLVVAFKIGFTLLALPAILAVGLIIGAFKGFAGAIGPFVATIESIIKGVVLVIKGLVEIIVGLVTGDMTKFRQGFIDLWNGLWSLVVSTLANLGKTIVNLVKGLVTGMFGWFKWVYDALVGHSIVPDMVNAILGWFRKLVDTGKSIIAGLGRFFTAFYGSYVAPFVNAIKNGINNVLSTISSIQGKVKRALSGAGSWLVNSGRDLVNGFIQGIHDKVGSAASTAANMAHAAWNAAKSALQINSPSKIFAELGNGVVEGFVKGIDQKTPDMVSQMSIFKDIIPKTPSANFGSPSDPLFKAGGNAPKAALNIENYYAPDDIDPRRQAEDWYFLVSARGGVA